MQRRAGLAARQGVTGSRCMPSTVKFSSDVLAAWLAVGCCTGGEIRTPDHGFGDRCVWPGYATPVCSCGSKNEAAPRMVREAAALLTVCCQVSCLSRCRLASRFPNISETGDVHGRTASALGFQRWMVVSCVCTWVSLLVRVFCVDCTAGRRSCRLFFVSRVVSRWR